MDKIIKVSLLVLALVALSYGRRHDHGADEESNSTCESQEIEEDYDLPLHVGSIFIQIGVSTISVFVPSILHRLHISLKSGVFVIISDILKFFGTGIIISTAFIHLLPAAFEQFGNECLTGVWADYGVGWVGVFAMIAAFAMQIIEFTALCKLDQMKREKSDSKLRLPESQDMEHPTGEIESQEAKHPHLISDKDNGHVHGLALVDDKDVRGLSIYILELGIALHSVLIGVTLSNTSGGEFVSLLIALIFHQSFEGLALGTRIVGGSFKLTRTLLLSSVLDSLLPSVSPSESVFVIHITPTQSARSSASEFWNLSQLVSCFTTHSWDLSPGR